MIALGIKDVIMAIRTTYDSDGLNQAEKDLKRLDRLYKNLGKRWSAPVQMAKGFQIFSGKLALASRKLQLYGQGFRGELLSIMLFSMQMKRTLDNVTASGVRNFTQLMEKSMIYGTAIQRLGLHWNDLKFTIGSAINTALAPLLPQILNIIEVIREWVATHPELTAKILIFGGIIAGVISTLAAMGLAIFGVLTFFGKLGGAIAWLGLKLGGWGAVWTWVWGIIAGAGKAIWAIFTGIGGIILKVGGWIIGVFTTLVTWIGAIVMSALELGAAGIAVLVAGLVGLGYIIYQIIKYGFVGFLKNVWQGIKNLIYVVKEWAVYLGGAFFDTVKKVFEWIWEKIVGIVDKFKELMDKIKGAGNDTKKAEDSVKGGKQFGGEITKTGLYRLHAGEQVVPAGNNFSGMNITINTAATNTDQIVREIDRKLMEAFGRHAAKIR